MILGLAEKDAGNYTVVLINKITKEEQRRSVQLLVNGMDLLPSPLSHSSLITLTSLLLLSPLAPPSNLSYSYPLSLSPLCCTSVLDLNCDVTIATFTLHLA